MNALPGDVFPIPFLQRCSCHIGVQAVALLKRLVRLPEHTIFARGAECGWLHHLCTRGRVRVVAAGTGT